MSDGIIYMACDYTYNPSNVEYERLSDADKLKAIYTILFDYREDSWLSAEQKVVALQRMVDPDY